MKVLQINHRQRTQFFLLSHRFLLLLLILCLLATVMAFDLMKFPDLLPLYVRNQ